MIEVLGWIALIAVMVFLLYFTITKGCEILDIDMKNGRTSLPLSSKEMAEWKKGYISNRINIATEQIKNKMSVENYNKFSNRFTIKANIAYTFIEDNITKDAYSPTTSIGLDETLNIIKIKLRKETIEELL